MRRNEQSVITGLDIGSTKVVAIAAIRNEDGKLEIMGSGHAEFDAVVNGAIMNTEQCTQAIEEAIAKCKESMPDMEIQEVYLSVGGEHIKSFQTSGERLRSKLGEEVGMEEVELLIHDQHKMTIPSGDEILDIIPQKFILDGQASVSDPIGMTCERIGADFHVITASTNAIRNLKRCVEKAGLKVSGMVLHSMASVNAIADAEDLEAGIVGIDIGGGTTNMAIYIGGVLKYTAVIPCGSLHITESIRNAFGILKSQAEQIKTEYGMAINEASEALISLPGLRGLPSKEISLRDLSNVIEVHIREIFDYVVYHLKQAKLDETIHGGIILTGGGAQLKQIAELGQSITGLTVRIGHHNVHMADDNAGPLMDPGYAACIGLIRYGHKDLEKGRITPGNNVPVKEEIYLITEAISVPYIPELNEPEPVIISNGLLSHQYRRKGPGLKGAFINLKRIFVGVFEDEALI